mgnify:CR=1 FL=1
MAMERIASSALTYSAMISNVNWIKFALLQDGEEDLMAVPALKSIVDVEQTSESGSSTSGQEDDQPSKLFVKISHLLTSENTWSENIRKDQGYVGFCIESSFHFMLQFEQY